MLLQRVAACCGVLRRVAVCRKGVRERRKSQRFFDSRYVCCKMLQCVLQYDAACCSVLLSFASCCSVLQRVAVCRERGRERGKSKHFMGLRGVCCRMFQRVAACCSMLQCGGRNISYCI